LFQFIGDVTLFGLQAVARFFKPPFELHEIWSQIAEAGSRSSPLVAASGFALGVVMTLHTRSTLVMFGAGAMIPRVQSLAFFVEIGPPFRWTACSGTRRRRNWSCACKHEGNGTDRRNRSAFESIPSSF
jgi:ABC-type transporter Mla maintaining outer membrane lipid asymmetry permease subunit MlaE